MRGLFSRRENLQSLITDQGAKGKRCQGRKSGVWFLRSRRVAGPFTGLGELGEGQLLGK